MAGLFADYLPVVFFLLPLLISWLLTASLLRLAPRFGLTDDPDPRKLHPQRTPGGGGLAIYVAMLVGMLLLPPSREADALHFLSLGSVIVVLGLIDDLRPLPWQLRLAVQTGAAIATVFLTLPAGLAWFVQAAAVLWIVGLTNAFNMLDNMDALSAGVAWIAAAFFTVAPWFRLDAGRHGQLSLPYLELMGALSGFLWFNRPPARIFMGDVGSTFLGFFLGALSLRDYLGNVPSPQRLAVPVCVLAVPCYDLVSVVALRLWQGRSPFHADKQHLSHRLVRLGLKSHVAVWVIYLLALASGTGGLLVLRTRETGALLEMLQLTCWWLAVAAIEYFGHYRFRCQS
jgi:UDP-GlcNAc:undecaprenyl-phosphate GlcNAc-1-phosphate transferase